MAHRQRLSEMPNTQRHQPPPSRAAGVRFASGAVLPTHLLRQRSPIHHTFPTLFGSNPPDAVLHTSQPFAASGGFASVNAGANARPLAAQSNQLRAASIHHTFPTLFGSNPPDAVLRTSHPFAASSGFASVNAGANARFSMLVTHKTASKPLRPTCAPQSQRLQTTRQRHGYPTQCSRQPSTTVPPYGQGQPPHAG